MKEKILKFLELIKSIFSRKNTNKHIKDDVEHTTNPDNIERHMELPKPIIVEETIPHVDIQSKIHEVEQIKTVEEVIQPDDIQSKMNEAADKIFLETKKPKKKPLPKAEKEPVVKKPKVVKEVKVDKTKTTKMKKEDKVGLEPKVKKPRTTKAKDGAVKSAD